MMITVAVWTMRRKWREALMVLAGVALTFGAYQVVRLASGDTTSRGGAAYSLLVGTNLGSGGAWNFADYQSFDLDRAMHGASEANRIALTKSFERVRAAPVDMVALMGRKFVAQWGNAAVSFSSAMAAPAASWLAIADAWALLVWLLALWSVVATVDLKAVEALALNLREPPDPRGKPTLRAAMGARRGAARGRCSAAHENALTPACTSYFASVFFPPE